MTSTSDADRPDSDLDELLHEVFAGRVVRKDLTKLVKEGANVPVYVLEYLLGQPLNWTHIVDTSRSEFLAPLLHNRLLPYRDYSVPEWVFTSLAQFHKLNSARNSWMFDETERLLAALAHGVEQTCLV